MRKHAFLLCLVALFCTAATDLPKHVTDAELLVANISFADNVYQHKGCFIKWKGEDGATKSENKSDCSDFLALLVEHSYGVTPEQIKEWTGRARPYADNWHDAIVAGKGFKRIMKLADAQPGDVLAIKFTPKLADTGHIMTMVSLPQPITATAPVMPDTQQWDVTIIDSSKHFHGPTDTRLHPDGTANTGVGKGVTRIYTDSSGAIVGYCWDNSKEAKFEPMNERHMVIGRLDVAK